MKYTLMRDPSLDKERIIGYRDSYGAPWLMISKHEGEKIIYSDFCLLTRQVENSSLFYQQPSVAALRAIAGEYRYAEEPSHNHPVFRFTEEKGHLYVEIPGDGKGPCLYVPDDQGGVFVPGFPQGPKIQFRFPSNPDKDYLMVTDVLTGCPQMPDKSRRFVSL
ncbi:MAG: hypothetical protein FJZ58_03355 [Chlamydiae bacterium]|nr:hypothetical protein [Chlamydiota bacterium]